MVWFVFTKTNLKHTKNPNKSGARTVVQYWSERFWKTPKSQSRSLSISSVAYIMEHWLIIFTLILIWVILAASSKCPLGCMHMQPSWWSNYISAPAFLGRVLICLTSWQYPTRMSFLMRCVFCFQLRVTPILWPLRATSLMITEPLSEYYSALCVRVCACVCVCMRAGAWVFSYHVCLLRSKLTNDDFRKLLMTPRAAPTTAPPSKSRHHEWVLYTTAVQVLW